MNPFLNFIKRFKSKQNQKLEQNKDSIIAKLQQDCSVKDHDINYLESVVVRLNKRIHTTTNDYPDPDPTTLHRLISPKLCPKCKSEIEVKVDLGIPINFDMYS
jgi:uncharacterized FlgJ-related protein